MTRQSESGGSHFSPIRAVLLDLDGTLADTVPDIAPAVNAVLAAFGRAPLDEATVASYVGRGADVLLQRALGGGHEACIDPALLERARAVFRPAYDRFNARAVTLYPGVLEGLEQLRSSGLALACVTNKPEAAARELLARRDLARFFGAVVGGDTLPTRKPDPAPLAHAASLLGVPLGACLMLGDSAIDAAAARAACIPIVLVDYGYREGLAVSAIDCDAVVTSIAEAARRLRPGADGFPIT
ncbi:MAG: phosphoglycolate phosphatase [Xanthomonadales bacterium]|nr:phosphoglycolate phosphatase [Xanthomonadales bacterium]